MSAITYHDQSAFLKHRQQRFLVRSIHKGIATMLLFSSATPALYAQGFPSSGIIELSELNTELPNAVSGVVINGIDSEDLAGFSVSHAGDINADGIDDVLISAPFADINGNEVTGETYAIFGTADNALPNIINLSSLTTATPDTLGLIINGVSAFDASGIAVSDIGDINDDDIDDFIISGSFAETNGLANTGQAYIIFGGTTLDTLVSSRIDLSALSTGTGNINGLVINGANETDVFANALSKAGDVNGDGVDDVIITSRYADPNGIEDAGSSYIIFGDSALNTLASPIINLSSLNTVTPDVNALTINGVAEQDEAGRAVNHVGDVNNDGIDDLIIGAPNAAPAGNIAAGQSYVLFGQSDLSILSSPVINLSDVMSGTADVQGLVINGENPGDNSGVWVSGAGDINGDGIDDIAIGAYRAAPNNMIDAGSSYILFGSDNLDDLSQPIIELSSLTTDTPDTPGLVINGVAIFDNSGDIVSKLGDINADDIDDLIIGAFNANPNDLVAAGESYVIFGNTNLTSGVIELSNLNNSTTGPSGLIIRGIAAGDRAGGTISASDINADGAPDIIIGALNAGDNDTGQAYIIYGQPLPLADISITMTNQVSFLNPLEIVNYTITVNNIGPNDIADVQIIDSLPDTLDIATASWECIANTGASCGTSMGTGNVSLLADLSAASSLIINLTTTVIGAEGDHVINTASVTVPAEVLDPISSNNSITDNDAIAGVFADSFENE